MGWADLQLERFGDFEALVCPPLHWTAACLHSHTCRWATVFQERGLLPGGRVILRLPGGFSLIVAMTAVVRAGGVAVVLSPGASELSLEKVWEEVNPCLSLTEEIACEHLALRAAQVAALERPVPRSSEDLAQIVYTSGSTGAPKGVAWSHGMMAARYLEYSDQRAGHAPARCSLCALPLWSAFGAQYFYLRLLQKMRLVVLPDFRPDLVARTVQEYQVQSAMFVPTMLEALLSSEAVESASLASLKSVLVGGAAVSTDLVKRFRKRFGTRLTGVYGLTELGPVARTMLGQSSGSLGRLSHGVEARVVSPDGQELWQGQVGEIEIRAGARAAPSDFGEWFATGDLGSFNSQGELVLAGRRQEVIDQGGMNVFLEPIREVLSRCPGVLDCAVLGVPDPFLGQAAVALVVGETPSGMVWDWCRRHLDRGRGPARVQLVEALPRTELGKLPRAELLELAQGQAESNQLLELQQLPQAERVARLYALVDAILERVLASLPAHDIPLRDVGLDSLAAVAVAHSLSARLGRRIPPMVTFNHPTRARLHRHFLRLLASELSLTQE